MQVVCVGGVCELGYFKRLCYGIMEIKGATALLQRLVETRLEVRVLRHEHKVFETGLSYVLVRVRNKRSSSKVFIEVLL